MQSRIQEELLRVSPAEIRDQGYELGHRGNFGMLRGVVDLERERSLSPRRREECFQRDFDAERREYGWEIGGRMTRSRSPPLRHYRGMPPVREYIDEERFYVGNGNNGHLELDARIRAKVMRDYDRDHGSCGYSVYQSGRLEESMASPKTMYIEEGDARGGVYKLHSDHNTISKYRETGTPMSVCTVEVGQFENDRYHDTERLDYVPDRKPNEVMGRPLLHSRDDLYNEVATSYSKDFAGPSSRRMQRKHLSPSLGDVPMSPDSYMRGGGKVRGSVGNLAYDQRPLMESTRDYEISQKNDMRYPQWDAYMPEHSDHHHSNLYEESRDCHGRNEDNVIEYESSQNNDMSYSQWSPCSPTRPERSDHHYRNLYDKSSDYHGIPPGDVHGMMPPITRVDYDRRDLQRSHRVHPTGKQFEINDHSLGDTRASNMMDHHIEKPLISDYPILSRRSAADRNCTEYMRSGYPHAELERRNRKNHELIQRSVSHYNHALNLKSDTHPGIDDDLEIQEERNLKIPPLSMYCSDMHRPVKRLHHIDEEPDLYEPLDRMPKGKQNLEIVSRFNNRRMLTKYNEPRNLENPYADEDWEDEDYNDEEMGDLYLHRPAKYVYTKSFGKADMSYDRQDRRGSFVLDGQISSHGSMNHSEHHSTRYFKHEHKYMKPYSKLGSSNWRNSYHATRKSGIDRDQSVWKRKDNFYEAETYNGDLLEDCDNPVTAGPHEDSEEFKKLVHEAFLSYSKRLNADPSTRGRYTKQGKAGTLFCIVCGRSCSKEFMDTRRLAMHAFMSHKPGLRVAHLGLLKAICILMGWDSDSPPNTVTWAPRILSTAEALSKKEDLILWPPLLIIHNISLLNSNPEEQKLINPEILEAYMRGKGFVDGKIIVSVGKPADNSIMVVKFRGTFTGLANVEKINQYFSGNNRGRMEFEMLVSNYGRISTSSSKSTGLQGENIEDLILYGYTGISEDLHKLDFSTKKSISIKSKKEIQDIADAPVRQT